MSGGDEVLKVETRNRVALATINRPHKRNAISHEVIVALDQLERSLTVGSIEARALVITGAGDKAFSAGADINELLGMTPRASRRHTTFGQNLFDRIESLPIVVIAAIDGVAFGGGLELAMAADIRIASPGSRFGQPEITLANIPGWGGTQRLPRLIGRGAATELILTGDPIGADDALRLRLVDHVVLDPVAFALALAEKIAGQSSIAVAGAKQAIQAGLESGLEHGLQTESDAVARCHASEQQHTAVQQFLERRNRDS